MGLDLDLIDLIRPIIAQQANDQLYCSGQKPRASVDISINHAPRFASLRSIKTQLRNDYITHVIAATPLHPPIKA